MDKEKKQANDHKALKNDDGNNDGADIKPFFTMGQVVDMSQLLTKWRNVVTQRKKVHTPAEPSADGPHPGNPKPTIRPVLWHDSDEDPHDAVDGSFGHQRAMKESRLNLNKSMHHYFIHVSTPGHTAFSDELDIEFICSLLSEGADLNYADAYKQTVLHEVAKNWSPSVMSVMIDLGGDPNRPDYRGRTPLHVAAATNFPEMCKLLVRKGADKEARATNQQTPLFFAAKTDSAQSLAALIAMECQFDNIFDYRGRTPLYCAAELDRSETAAMLVENDADAFVKDDSGQVAFVPMIEKMPPVAKEALRQVHKVYRIERKQHFALFRLDPKVVIDCSSEHTRSLDKTKLDECLNAPHHSVLKAITDTKNYGLIEEPVIKKFIGVQWMKYGRFRALLQIAIQLVTIILWTVFAVDKEWTSRYHYDLPQEIYRIVILVGAIGLTVYSIVEEIIEYLRARRRHAKWQKWRKDQLQQDAQFCHQRQRDESEYLKQEIAFVENKGISYFEDSWNYLDWTCYLILIMALVTHFVDVGYPGGEGNLIWARWHVRLLAINIILLWLRLLKYVKPFEFFGPFIVMLGMITSDVLKFLLLYLEFFIPFACVFWTILGGKNNLKEADIAASVTLSNYSRFNFTKVNVKNFDTFNNLLFTMFRLTLVDDYDYDNMVEIDQITAQILLGAWFAVSTILFLNLFIAQLSETFKAVYDNAKAAAAMEKATTLIGFYESMWQRTKIKYHTHLHSSCNPLVIDYDDDVTSDNSGEEIQKATLQIRDTVEDMKQKIDRLYRSEIDDSDDEQEALNPKSRQLTEGLASIHDRVANLENSVQRQLTEMRNMLRDIAIVVSGGTADDQEEAEDGEGREE